MGIEAGGGASILREVGPVEKHCNQHHVTLLSGVDENVRNIYTG